MKSHSFSFLCSTILSLLEANGSHAFNMHSSHIISRYHIIWLPSQRSNHHGWVSIPTKPLIALYSQSIEDETTNLSSTSEIKRSLGAAPLQNDSIEIKLRDNAELNKPSAKTNTVNERLMAELQAAADAERGPKTPFGEKLKNSFRYSDKTDEEREAALEAARDLNGVNPTVTILASFFAFFMAYGFWAATQFFGELFLSHPVSADAPYAFARLASVFRNVVMGLSSLASGFALVSGLGVFLLGVRVAYGVFTGELDPTPITKPGRLNNNDNIEIPNVWDLMMNKKPSKRGRR